MKTRSIDGGPIYGHSQQYIIDDLANEAVCDEDRIRDAELNEEA